MGVMDNAHALPDDLEQCHELLLAAFKRADLPRLRFAGVDLSDSENSPRSIRMPGNMSTSADLPLRLRLTELTRSIGKFNTSAIAQAPFASHCHQTARGD